MGEILILSKELFYSLLDRLEKHASQVATERSFLQWRNFSLDVFFILVVGYLCVFGLWFIEAGGFLLYSILSGGEVPTMGQFFKHTIDEFFHGLPFGWPALNWSPFILAVLGSSARLRSNYKNAEAEYKNDRVAIDGLKTEIQEINNRFPATIQQTLISIANENPIKAIIGALNPTNEHLERVIGRVAEDIASRMHLFRNVLMMPERARKSLAAITDLSRERAVRDGKDGENHWSDLYIAFAITMQLEPWQSAFENEKFVFVRDIEELRCFHNPDRLKDEFRAQLHKDFVEMLHLVNGRLISLMYRDISAWRDWRYCEQNAVLLERKKQNNSDSGLQRLFVIEKSWKTPNGKTYDARFISAIMGAMWHSENGYKAKFIDRNLIRSKLIPSKDSDFLASCMLNDTVIKMHAKYARLGGRRTDADPEYERYIYECDSGERVVQDYIVAFDQAWKAAQDADQFVVSCKLTSAAAVEQAENEFRGVKESIARALSA